MPAHRGVGARGGPSVLASAAFASCAVGASLTAHVTVGGRAPDGVTLLAAPVLVQMAHRLVARWCRGPRAGVVLLLGVELALHVLFRATAPVDADSECAGMLMAGGSAMSMRHAGSVSGAIAMAAAHLVCAAVLGTVLYRGERAVLGLGRFTSALAGQARCGARHLLARVAAGIAVLLADGCADPRAGRGRTMPPCWLPSSCGIRLLGAGGRFWRGPPDGPGIVVTVGA